MIARANGVPLYFEKRGEGPPLLLLHGNGEDHHIFDVLAGELCGSHTLYALDSRCHGRSGRTEDLSYEAMAEDVRAFIGELGLERPSVVGFSDGAITALLLAMKCGGLLGKLALLGPNLSPRDFTDECRADIERTFAATGGPLLALMLREPDLTPAQLAGIRNEALVFGGENDVFKPGVLRAIADAIPNAELRLLAGHTHDSYLVGSGLLGGPLRDFFAGT